VLRNYLIHHRVTPYVIDADAYILNGTWQQDAAVPVSHARRAHGNNARRQAKQFQEMLRDWFWGPGTVEWLDRMVTLGQGLIQNS